MKLEANSALILAKTACLEKTGKTPFFNRIYLRNEWSKLKSVLIFRKFEGSSLENVVGRFSPSPLLHPENQGRKSGPEFHEK